MDGPFWLRLLTFGYARLLGLTLNIFLSRGKAWNTAERNGKARGDGIEQEERRRWILRRHVCQQNI